MILLLAGTTEARIIALSMKDEGIDGIASLSGATEKPELLALPMRRGGFGGADGFRDFIRANNITAVVDATHPYAARITDRTARICAEDGIPYLQVLRSGWEQQPGDDWRWIDHPAQAADIVPVGATVFLAIGRAQLPEYAALSDRRVIFRTVDPLGTKPDFGEAIVGRPPFSVEHETKLLSELGVSWLVSKDAGGPSRAKLDAARALGIPVIMLRRPPMPDAQRVTTVTEAMDWIRAL